MKAYKVFNSDWTCRGFQYKVGETYNFDGEIELCGRGFHACENVVDCFNYYPLYRFFQRYCRTKTENRD